MKKNIFESVFGYRISPPEPKWSNIPILNEKDLKKFFVDNIYWLEEFICNMFKFTKIEFLGTEYCVRRKRFDMAFRHGEDIIIVELKYQYGAETTKAYYQLQNYEKIVSDKYLNKVYKVLVTTHLTKGTIELFKNEKNKTGIILLHKSDIRNYEHLHCINFTKTQYGFIR